MPVRCRIVLVSMEKQGGCGISDPSLRGGGFFVQIFLKPGRGDFFPDIIIQGGKKG